MLKRSRMQSLCFILILLTVVLLNNHPVLTRGDGPPQQPAEQVYNEMQTVYLGNLARRDNGVPPLCWNAPMTDTARCIYRSWFDPDNSSDLMGFRCVSSVFGSD